MNKLIRLLNLLCTSIIILSCDSFKWDLPEKDFPVCNEPNATVRVTSSGLMVNLSISNLQGPVTQLQWDMGDGTTSTQTSDFSYTYRNAGTYTIKLNLRNTCGDTKTLSYPVSVTGIPAVSTLDATDVVDTKFVINMSISSSGSSLVTQYGVCMSNILSVPAIENSTVITSNGNPAVNTRYSFKFENLKVNTSYYCRAFARNSSGLSYGQVLKINTMPISAATNTLIFPLDLKGRDSPICFVINKKLYTGMGADGTGTVYNDLWEYDPAKNSWTQKASLPSSGRVSAVGFTVGSKGYVGLGYNGTAMLDDFWEYDPSTDAWTKKASLPATGRWAAFGLGHSQRGYVGGGSNNSLNFKDFWEYDPSGNTWTRKVDLPFYKVNGSGFSIGSFMYMGFGQNMDSQTAGEGPTGRDFWQYNASSNVWVRKPDIPSNAPYETKINFTIGDKGYIGRFDADSPNNLRMYTYTPSTERWIVSAGLLAIPRFYGCGGAIDNVAYYGFGGANNNLLNDFWLFKP
ncbi:Kelch repeat-containing protein [Emticicia sp. 17c]|uniref:Kelch repeat-containing protein n=1 Tax=Emticicia sp. 17c TaxID=3127704 RepID=UPI00301BE164